MKKTTGGAMSATETFEIGVTSDETLNMSSSSPVNSSSSSTINTNSSSRNGDSLDHLRAGAEPTTAELFDLDALRAPQEYEELIGAKRALVVVPVRKPHSQEWVRTHPAPEYQMAVFILSVEAERTDCVVVPKMVDVVGPEARRVLLVTTLNRQQDCFLWPVRLPSDGKRNDWNESALEGAHLAARQWVRLASNQTARHYDIHVAPMQHGDPEWPDATFAELVSIAFKHRIIDSPEHPVVKRLHGLA
jgi:hypothetical protein